MGDTPLHIAVRRGHIEIAELLIANQANVNVPNNRGITPLHSAISEGHYRLVGQLIKYGAHLNAVTSDQHNTALTLALSQNQMEIAQYLIEQGANVRIEDIQTIQARQADIIQYIGTWAAQKGRVDIIEYFFNNKNTIKIISDNDWEMQLHARQSGHTRQGHQYQPYY